VLCGLDDVLRVGSVRGKSSTATHRAPVGTINDWTGRKCFIIGLRRRIGRREFGRHRYLPSPPPVHNGLVLPRLLPAGLRGVLGEVERRLLLAVPLGSAPVRSPLADAAHGYPPVLDKLLVPLPLAGPTLGPVIVAPRHGQVDGAAVCGPGAGRDHEVAWRRRVTCHDHGGRRLRGQDDRRRAHVLRELLLRVVGFESWVVGQYDPSGLGSARYYQGGRGRGRGQG